MQVTYDGEHSLLIGDFINGKYDESGFIHTWKDWHLIPKSKPIIVPPEPQSNTIEVPGMNGKIDITERLLGYPIYYNRTGSLEFYVDDTQDGWDWQTAYDTILNAIHGFNRKVILCDSPSFYYEGRLSVNEFKSEKMCDTIVIDYDFAPFRQMLFTTTEHWLWNPFDFLNGIIIDPSMFIFSIPAGANSQEIVFDSNIAGVMPVYPVITAITDGISTGFGRGEPSFIHHHTSLYPAASRDYFSETDHISDSYTHSTYVFRPYTMIVAKPIPNFSFSFFIGNRFRNAQDEYIPATYYFDFRPGRL